MKKYKKFCFLGIGLLPLVLASCGTNTAIKDSQDVTKKVEQVATLSAGTPVQSLDPATAVDQTSITLLANVMEGLYRLDEKNQPQPAIAAGQPKVSNNGKTYTIVIRDGAKWADGTQITASDFVAAWQRVVDPKTASPEDAPLAGEYAKQYKKDKEYSTTLMANTMFLEMDQTGENKLLQNKNVRKAISYAIDRESLVKKLLDNGSVASDGVVSKEMVFNPINKKDFANEKLVEFNKKQAEEYWDKAKKEIDLSKNTSLDLLVSDGEFEKKGRRISARTVAR
ncbi:Pheromone binding protein TraC/PrgZ [Enterococcus faecalis NY9]|nr:Pheromone binding protein TraC/PrgZ [Enterococcus faecalis NY9]